MMSITLLTFLHGEVSPDLRFQGREMIPDSIPEDCQPDTKLGMGKNIAETCNPPPIWTRVFFLEIFGNIFHCLSDNFEIPDNSVNPHGIRGELFERSILYLTLNPVCRFENII
jgi:hypothetical protein